MGSYSARASGCGPQRRPSRRIGTISVSRSLDRAAVEKLYDEFFGTRRMNFSRVFDAWFYRPNEGLNNQRPIDVIGTPEGVRSIRALFERMSAGNTG